MLKDTTASGTILHPGALLELADQMHSTAIPRDYAPTFLPRHRAKPPPRRLPDRST